MDSAEKPFRDKNSFSTATVADIGLTRKGVFEARQIRDAEIEEPGIRAYGKSDWIVL